MNITRILVGIDFSAESETALAHALCVARHTGAEVVLGHAGNVPDPTPDIPDTIRAAADRYRELASEHLADSRARLEELRQRHTGQGVELSHMMIDAFPDTGLAEAAAELRADLVVVGTHGRTGLRRFLLGSVAERVVRLTETAVMVARPPAPAAPYRRILVPTDFSPVAERAVEAAVALAAPGAAIDLLHLWQLPALALGDWAPAPSLPATVEPLRAELADSARVLGDELLARHRTDRVALAYHHADEPPVPGIQVRLERGGYDLVVMGSHGRRGLRRWLLGSVAEATVRYSPCSVLVLHAGPPRTPSAG
jgi:nucleotide-binding universal stress UspA family protein